MSKNINKILVVIIVILISVTGLLFYKLYQKDIPKNTDQLVQTEEAIINNEDPEIPELTTQETVVIKADEIVQKLAEDKKLAQKTYTNQFFPNLKIVYNEDWSFVTTTDKSKLYEGLLEREITLSKNGTELYITLVPQFGTGCFDNPDFVSPDPLFTTQKNNLKEFSDGDNKLIYTKTYECFISQQLVTNIPVGDITNYKQFFPDDQNVKYFYQINTNIEDSKKATNSELNELREILNNSVFE